MNRRKATRALSAFAAVAAAKFSFAQARPKTSSRVGMLFGSAVVASVFAPLRPALRDLGWVEGREVTFDERIADGGSAKLATMAAELVRTRPDVIVVANLEADAVIRVTRSIPIVVAGTLDPIAAGFTTGLARPSGSVTGIICGDPQVASKLVQILHEAVPTARRLGALYLEGFPGIPAYVGAYKTAADAAGLDLRHFGVRNSDEIARALANVGVERVDGLLIVPNGLSIDELGRILAFAAERRLPTGFPNPLLVEMGGLFSYAPDVSDTLHRLAVLIDKILKGAKPGDLPFEYPSRYALTINLKTAKALGIRLPQAVLLRADKLIE